MAKVFHFGKENFVTSGALKRYRDDNNLTNAELTAQLGLAGKYWNTVATWCSKGRVPVEALRKLGLSQRRRGGKRSTAVPAGGSLYVCYVGAADVKRFKEINAALGIEVKSVL